MDAPSYVRAEHKEREIFLSQIGNFTYSERMLFHALCENWQPIIEWHKFLKENNLADSNSDTDLTKLMGKLKEIRAGILIYQVQTGLSIPQGIMLCEQDDIHFYLYLLKEEVQSAIRYQDYPLPTIARIAENFEIPSEYITNLSYADISDMIMLKNLDAEQIASLKLMNKDVLVFPLNSINAIVEALILRIKKELAISQILDMLSRYSNKTLTDLRTGIQSADRHFWIMLCKTFNENRVRIIDQQSYKLPDDFFQFTYFIENIFIAMMEASAKRRKIEQDCLASAKNIAKIVKNSSELIVPEEIVEQEINNLEYKFQENFEEFKKCFNTTILQNEGKHGIPTLVKIQEQYIHSDNIREFFINRVHKASRQLLVYYQTQMSQFISKIRYFKISTFQSLHNFEDDISQKVKETDSYLHNLLENPTTVAEAFIQAARKSGQIRGVGDMKKILAGFFYPEKLEFRELQYIFNLNTRQLYDRSFTRLGFFRQLFMRIIGRHNNLRLKFSQQSSMVFKAPSDQKLNADQESLGYESQIQSQGTSNKRRSTRKSGRIYSKRERERVWSDFAKHLKD